MMHQQAGQLPVPVHQLIATPVEYNLQQPPVLLAPRNPAMQPYAGLVTAILANRITFFAVNNPNPLRVFSFNMLSMNGWNNQDFILLFTVTMDSIAAEGVNLNDFNAVDNHVQKILNMHCAHLAMRYQAVLANIQQQAIPMVQNNALLWDQMVNALGYNRGATAADRWVGQGSGMPMSPQATSRYQVHRDNQVARQPVSPHHAQNPSTRATGGTPAAQPAQPPVTQPANANPSYRGNPWTVTYTVSFTLVSRSIRKATMSASSKTASKKSRRKST